jgi:ubiquitin carboxyl-terminal hydrolase L3
MVHAVSNNLQNLSVSNTGVLKSYIDRVLGLDPHKRGMNLASDKTIAQLHSSFASQGQTAGIPEGQSSNHHFVCLTEIRGDVYELDGCKPFPINHGSPSKILGDVDASSSPFPFLSSAARVIQENYLKDPSVIDFSIIALAANADD